MKDKIKKILGTLGIDKYIIEDNKKESVELFFIRKRLDMRRMTDIREINVTVFKDFEETKDGETRKFRGSSKCVLYPSMTDDEIKKSLSDAYLAAGFVKNEFYEMPAGEKNGHTDVASNIADKGLEEAAGIVAAALFAEDTRSDVFLNTVELFVFRTDRSITSSFGADVGYTKWNIEGEFVAQAKEPQDVETYRGFEYDDIDEEAIRANVRRTFEMTKARAQAEKSPENGTCDVIISGQDLRELLEFFLERANAGAIYPKYSDYKIGTKAQGENIEGDALTIDLSSTVPYNSEGISIKDRRLLEKGEVKSIVGNSRFCYYLGVEPTGMYDTLKVEKGKVSLEEMKKKECLHCVNFSGLEVDYMTGDFGSEVRLGFLCKDGKETPVTHFSISGNLYDVVGKLTLSSDGFRESGYDGPFAVRIPGLSVAGE